MILENYVVVKQKVHFILLFSFFPLQMNEELKRTSKNILDIRVICVLPRFYWEERELQPE